MAKTKTSLSFDETTWKEFRKRCIDQSKQYTAVLEELMKKWLEK